MKINKTIHSIFLIIFSFLGAFFGVQYFDTLETEPKKKYYLDTHQEAKLSQNTYHNDKEDASDSDLGIQIGDIENGESQVTKKTKEKIVLEKKESELENINTSKSTDIHLSLGSKDTNFIFPDTYDHQVPFHPQSPFGMWGDIFGETCEEASVLLAYSYFQGPHFSAGEFREELLKIVDWQNKVFGDFRHTDVEQTGQILGEFYKYSNYEIIENPSVEEMKYHLSSGSLLLAPFYGVGLNPYYSGIGPEYHFMLIKGYTPSTFITHDVGTKRGKNYQYPIDILMERMHDYHPESVQLGAKKIIRVWSR